MCPPVLRRHTTGMSQGRIDQLAATTAELGQILRELRGDGLREPVGPDPLLNPDLPAGTLDEFLSLAVRECSDANLFGLALALPMCAFQRGAGYEALEYVLTRRGLAADKRDFIAGRMLGARSPADVVWAHGIVLRTRNTGLYHSFLSRHARVVAEKCFDQLATYLLDPARGPGGFTASCVELVLQQGVGAPRLFVRRWLEWIDAGLFDGLGAHGGERPAVLYRVLDDNAEREVFAPLREAAHRRIASLVGDGRLAAAWRHLAGAVDAGYSGAPDLADAVRPAIDTLDDDARAALAPAWSALTALAEAQRRPDEASRRRAQDARTALSHAAPPV